MVPRVVRAAAVQLRLADGLRAGDVEAVAQRRVDAERHVPVQPVVDHGGDEWTLVGGERLLLHHRGDDQHVVRREVLPPRVGEVELGPVLAERLQLLQRQLPRRCDRCEVVGGREEEALDRALAEGRLEPARRAEVGLRRQCRAHVPLAARDRVHRRDPRGHVLPRESLREDDPQRRRGRRRRLGRRRTVALRADGQEHDRKHDPHRDEKDERGDGTAAGDLLRRGAPPRRRTPRHGRDHASTLLDHVR